MTPIIKTTTTSSVPAIKQPVTQTTTTQPAPHTVAEMGNKKSSQAVVVQSAKVDSSTSHSSSTHCHSEEPIKSQDGILLRHVVPSDNSCLFTSVFFVMENGTVNLDAQKALRQLIAQTVMSDKQTFNEAILGKKNKEYCDWIKNTQNWGGAIEIVILSKYYKIEICVVDVQSGRIDRFGEDCNYPIRVFIIYDGIHFDPLYLQPFQNDSQIQTKFQSTDELIMHQAYELADEAKRAKQYTDVTKFTLKCLDCKKLISGQKDAQQHAESTGHINFDEV